MTTITRAVTIRGEVRATDDLTLEGRVEGPIWCEHGELIVTASAEVLGDIIARDIVVFGQVTGQIVGTEVVDVRASADVDGRVIARRFILEAGATFRGRVEPQHLDTAIRVARFQQQKNRKAGSPYSGSANATYPSAPSGLP
jgi:cytoskeletal protein CcmA (bactofilin family)